MLDTKRLKFTSHGATPPNIFSDSIWLRQHQTELLERYGECSIVVYMEQVIGVGVTLEESLENAERNLPPEVGEITPVQDFLVHPNPFLRIQPQPLPKQEHVHE